jgi:hypothetical protein
MKIKIFCRCSLFPSWSGWGLISAPVSKQILTSYPRLPPPPLPCCVTPQVSSYPSLVVLTLRWIANLQQTPTLRNCSAWKARSSSWLATFQTVHLALRSEFGFQNPVRAWLHHRTMQTASRSRAKSPDECNNDGKDEVRHRKCWLCGGEVANPLL